MLTSNLVYEKMDVSYWERQKRVTRSLQENFRQNLATTKFTTEGFNIIHRNKRRTYVPFCSFLLEHVLLKYSEPLLTCIISRQTGRSRDSFRKSRSKTESHTQNAYFFTSRWNSHVDSSSPFDLTLKDRSRYVSFVKMSFFTMNADFGQRCTISSGF